MDTEEELKKELDQWISLCNRADVILSYLKESWDDPNYDPNHDREIEVWFKKFNKLGEGVAAENPIAEK